ncbi:MAG: chemotaxis protein CheB, partial [Isosphaeraceae bacterium]
MTADEESLVPETSVSGIEGDGPAPRLVVGIGASAGGLEALERLFEAMPTDTGMAFIVVQHLSPNYKSLTDEILVRRTRIPIQVVEDGMRVRPDSIFLIPPRKDMILGGGRLLLTDKDPGRFVTLPIDLLLRSLAQEAGDRAVAIILSGTGSDGSRGVRDVHEAGGLVIVQDPDTAKFDGMPRSAIDTGVSDLTLAPESIPEALLRHARSPHGESLPSSPMPTGVEAIFRLLREAHGIDFSLYKPDTVARRLERRLSLGEVPSLDEYARRLAADPAELNLLYKDLLIGVTRFFRDEEAFARLGRDVLPEVLDRLGPGEEFRAWVAGCATGEEAYSLAILVREGMEAAGRTGAVKIFATDAHRASLDLAGAGVYPEAACAGVGIERMDRFFTRVAAGYQVSADLRKSVVFAQHNVLKDAPFTKLDLVTCRNLLIYFRPAAQKRVLSLFHFALKAGGILFLGPSETPGEVSDEFEALDPRWRVYRKRRDVRLVTDLRLMDVTPQPRSPAMNPPPPPDLHLAGTYDALLDQLMPPSVLVNDRGAVIQSFGGASKYLRFREGRITTDLLELVDPEMRMALTGALPRAFKELTQITYKGLRDSSTGGDPLINVTVRPIRNRRSGVNHALVQFEEVGESPPAQEVAHEIDLGQASREQVLALEGELRYTKENLQAVIEEMETSNEELQSTNEELTAANEELQSTNEELHSVNEELYTVNAEYQKKIAELTEMTADMDNLLISTEVHTIFLDRNLCIRKFTPKIAETFNLMPQDVGRRIDNFTYTIDHPGLMDDLGAVLSQSSPLERQVRDRRGNWFLLRILPYRSGLATNGVVLTLVDLAGVKRAEADRWRTSERLNAILLHSPNWIFVKDVDGKYVLAADSFRQLVHRDSIGKTAGDLFPPEVAEKLTRGDERVLRDGEVVQEEIEVNVTDDPRTFLSVKFPLRDEAGRITGIGGINTDVTQIRDAERTAREAVAQRDRFLAMLSHELRNPLAAILNAAEMASRAATVEADPGRWIGVIERRARHMARLVDDLLDVARITHDKIELRRSDFDLSTTVPEVIEEVREGFEVAGVTLVLEGPETALMVNGDPDRLEQVQVNLLRNAAKYTPAGGRVWYTVGREDGQAVIRVRDTGVGLAPDMIAKVFDPFFQADKTLARVAGGIGVGLTLVRSIIELHGGTVELRSDGLGKGCEFVVRLPLSKREPASSPPIDPGAESQIPISPPEESPALRLLVVEDDPDIRQSLVQLLGIAGHQVRSASKSEAALDALKEDRVDAALLDIGLPGIDGYELARRIRRGSGPQPFLIALTGYGRPEDRAAAALAGFDAHLTKPFRPEELDQILRSARRDPPPQADGHHDRP